MKFVNNNILNIKFKDIAVFTDEVSDLDLVDIINDVTKEKITDDYVSSPGAFVYELDLMVDSKKVVDLGISGFKVKFYDKNPDIILQNDKSETNGHIALEKEDTLSEFLMTMVPKPVFEVDLDLDIPLSNPNFTFMGMQNKKLNKYIIPIMLSQSPITKNNQSAAKITAVPSLYTLKNSNPNETFSEVAKKAKMGGGLSLQTLSSVKPTLLTLSSKLDKAITTNTTPQKKEQTIRVSLDNITERKSLVSEREKIKPKAEISSLVSAINSTLSSNTNLAPVPITLGYSADIETSFISFKREIEIPKSILGSRNYFYIKLQPVLKTSTENIPWLPKKTIEPITIIISHKQKIQEMLTPIYPPEIKALVNRRGSVVLSVKQTDPVATNIVVERIVTSQNKGTVSTVIKELELEVENLHATIIDYHPENTLPNEVEYTAITVSPFGEEGLFSSILVDSFHNINVPYTSDIPNDLSIIAKNDEDGIRVEIEQIPEDVISVRLLCEDLSKTGDFVSNTRVVDTNNKTQVLTIGDRDKVEYYDVKTNINRHYRYFCAMRSRLGQEFLSVEDEHIIRKKPMKPLPVEVFLENLSLTNDSTGRFVVSIDVLSLPKAESMNLLLGIMKTAGISSVFMNEIEKQKSNFASLASFIVERVDRVTGKRVSFGIQPPGTFIDNTATQSKVNAPPLEQSGRYTYYFKLCLQHPQSFMKNVFATFSSKDTPGIENKSALASKFLSSYSSAFGVLPSDAELVKGISVGEAFRLGETGTTLSMGVQIPYTRPVPEKLRIKKIKRRGSVNKLLWQASNSSMKEVQGCFVFVEYAGKAQTLGFVKSSGKTVDFAFYDNIFVNEVGTKTYYVQFLYKKSKKSSKWFELSAKSNTAKDTKFSSIKILKSQASKMKILGIVPTLLKKGK
jgi:hypothetical protein